jgi:hypothetical protein
MLRTTAAALLALALVTSSACYTAGVISPAPPGVKRQSDHGVIWFWGMWRSETNADECRAGLAEVAVWTPWYGYIVSPITLGIAHPVVKTYSCAVGDGF